MVAALYVQPDGCYSGLPGVLIYTESEVQQHLFGAGVFADARRYPGPHPVVAHPPCERWGRYWHGGPSARVRRVKGDDAGCFEAALASVRQWGGVIEHPEASGAWDAFGIPRPPRCGGWVEAGRGAWTCCVEQGHYGHRARKATWLYTFGPRPPDLRWGPSHAGVRLDAGFHTAAERAAAVAAGWKPSERIGGAELAATPVAFRDLLLSIARAVRS